MKKKLLFIVGGIVIIGLIGYVFTRVGLSQPQSQSNKIHVTTSFYPLYFFASHIAGDKATVYNITPAGAEPHDYEPTTQDVARIEDSKLLVLNGGKLEAWGDKIKDILKNTPTVVIAVGETLANQNIIEEGESSLDPHVWLDPVLAKKEVVIIADGLKQIDPSNAEYYETNAQALESKLDNLNQAYVVGLSKCQKKDIITSHAAFGYLARQYSFNQVSISGLSPDAEPSPQQLANVAKFAKKNNVKYIFFESLVSPKLSETIAHEVGAQTLVLNPIEGLSDEELAKGKNYFTEMESNLKNLRTALECE